MVALTLEAFISSSHSGRKKRASGTHVRPGGRRATRLACHWPKPVPCGGGDSFQWGKWQSWRVAGAPTVGPAARDCPGAGLVGQGAISQLRTPAQQGQKKPFVLWRAPILGFRPRNWAAAQPAPEARPRPQTPGHLQSILAASAWGLHLGQRGLNPKTLVPCLLTPRWRP